MKTIVFPLNKAVRIIPVSGNSEVSVKTSGEVMISTVFTHEGPHARAITIADTGKAILSRSPMGHNRTIKITLATEEATENEFHNQISQLFALSNNIINTKL